MRLIDARTGRLETVVADNPCYAILSHTWGDREVTFTDLPVDLRPASDKIENTCRLAQDQGIPYVWIDTCCIDKSSSAELTESINSMFNWYQKSAVCYVFLEDLDPNCTSIAECRWFTRGWTLQELLAPTEVKFYDKKWNFRGLKQELNGQISTVTRIPDEVLLGKHSLESCSVASRMSWAAGRKTSKPEDVAYSLLGLFNVHMPPIYGEGKNAFRRLQEEIIKRSNDLTILAWGYPQSDDLSALHTLGLLAESPDYFRSSATINPFRDDITTRFAITNQGLYVSGDAPLRLMSVADGKDKDERLMYALFLGAKIDTEEGKHGGIYLRKIGPNLFRRDFQYSMAGFDDNDTLLETRDVPDYHILIEPNATWTMARFFRRGALHVLHSDDIQVLDAVPAPLWDHRDQIFLKSKPYSWVDHEAVLALKINWSFKEDLISLLILCDCRGSASRHIARILPLDSAPAYAMALFSPRKRNVAVSWEDLEAESPDVLKLANEVEVRVGNSTLSFSARVKGGISKRGLKLLILELHANEKQPQLPRPFELLTLDTMGDGRGG